MWEFICSNKPELVRREICVSDLTSGGLKSYRDVEQVFINSACI